MWSSVQTGSGPSTRTKHAMCVSRTGTLYLLGGRSANLPLKDLWMYDPAESSWEELKCRGHRPPCLQEHTMVFWKNTIYVFGGEIGFASTGETPLWILDICSQTWKKHHVRGSSSHQPSGRRGHSAVVHGAQMHVFGGYQDLRGSSSELWTFDLGSEKWHLLLTPSYFEQPPPRHNHSCVVHDGAMWIYGGLTDLQPRADFWKWDFGTHQWSRVKTTRGPGELHGHAAVKGMAFMYVFGGERSGIVLNELWRFHFATCIWERVQAEGVLPPPCSCHVAVPNPELESKGSASNAWSDDRVPNRVPPPKSVSMCFGQSQPEPEGGRRYFRFRVHPVSRLCSKNTSSDEEDEEDSAAYSATAAQVNLRTLRDKFHSSRLVRSISSGSYSILHNQGAVEARKDELEKLVEERSPRQQPRLKIQKSQSSDAVLECEGAAAPQQQPRPPAPNVTDSPPLWVENPNTLLRSSWSENTFRTCGRTNGGEHHSTCTTPTARLSRLAFDGPLSTVRDVIEENSESADEPTLAESTGVLVDLGEEQRQHLPARCVKSSHTISDFTLGELPRSTSHSSGYQSFTDEDYGADQHRDFAGCLNNTAVRRLLLKGRDLELKTFEPSAAPPQRARSLERTSQRKLVRSYPSGGSITPTILMSEGVVEDSFVSAVEQRVARRESPVRRQSGSPAGGRREQHRWQLCLYVFGGREQGAPGIYRQPISVWKLYV